MAEQRVDIYNVVDKDGNVVDTLRYPQGGSLYEGAKHNRDINATNRVYSAGGDAELYEPLFNAEDVSAATDMQINPLTGKIKITAPQSVLNSEWFDSRFKNNDVFKQVVKLYLNDPSADTSVEYQDKDGNIVEKKVSDWIDEERVALKEYAGRYMKDILPVIEGVKNTTKAGITMTDKEAIISQAGLNRNKYRYDDRTAVYLPSAIMRLGHGAFEKMGSWDADTRTVSAKDFYDWYDLSDDKGKDFIEMEKVLNWQIAHYFNEEEVGEGDAEELARTLSFYKTLTNDDPEANFIEGFGLFIQSFHQGFKNTIVNASVNLYGFLEDASAFVADLTSLSTDSGKVLAALTLGGSVLQNIGATATVATLEQAKMTATDFGEFIAGIDNNKSEKGTVESYVALGDIIAGLSSGKGRETIEYWSKQTNTPTNQEALTVVNDVYDRKIGDLIEISGAANAGRIVGSFAGEIVKQIALTNLVGGAVGSVVKTAVMGSTIPAYEVVNFSKDLYGLTAAMANGLEAYVALNSIAENVAAFSKSVEILASSLGAVTNLMAQGVVDTILNDEVVIRDMLSDPNPQNAVKAYEAVVKNTSFNIFGEVSGLGFSIGNKARKGLAKWAVDNTVVGATVDATTKRVFGRIAGFKHTKLAQFAEWMQDGNSKAAKFFDKVFKASDEASKWYADLHWNEARAAFNIAHAARGAESLEAANEATQRAVLDKMQLEVALNNVTRGVMRRWMALVRNPAIAKQYGDFQQAMAKAIKAEGASAVDIAGVKYLSQETADYIALRSIVEKLANKEIINEGLSTAESAYKTALEDRIAKYVSSHSDEVKAAADEVLNQFRAYEKAYMDFAMAGVGDDGGLGLYDRATVRGWRKTGYWGKKGEEYIPLVALKEGETNVAAAKRAANDWEKGGNYKAKLSVDEYEAKPGDIDAHYLDPSLVLYSQQVTAAKVLTARDWGDILLKTDPLAKEINMDGMPVVKSDITKARKEIHNVVDTIFNDMKTQDQIFEYNFSESFKRGVADAPKRAGRKILRMLGLSKPQNFHNAAYSLEAEDITALVKRGYDIPDFEKFRNVAQLKRFYNGLSDVDKNIVDTSLGSEPLTVKNYNKALDSSDLRIKLQRNYVFNNIAKNSEGDFNVKYNDYIISKREQIRVAEAKTKLTKAYKEFADAIEQSELRKVGLDDFSKLVNGLVEDSITLSGDALKDNQFLAQMLKKYADAGVPEDVAKRYLILQEYRKYFAKGKSLKSFRAMIDKNLSSLEVSGNLSTKNKLSIVNSIRDGVREQLDSEWAKATKAVQKAGGGDLLDTEDIFNYIHKQMSDFIDTTVKNPNVIQVLDKNGIFHLYEVSPSTANLYTTRPNMAAYKQAQPWKFFNKTNRLARIGNVGYSLRSFMNQWVRDPLNAYVMGGMVRTLGANSSEMGELLGPQVVEMMREALGEAGWKSFTEDLTKQLGREASEEEIQAAAKEALSDNTLKEMSDLALGDLGIETEYYREMAEGYKDAVWARFDSEAKTGKKVLDKLEEHSLGNFRETYLRKGVYAQTFNDAIASGKTIQEAKTIAEFTMLNATTNFSRAFAWGNHITSSVSFLGAAINGKASFWRLLEVDPIGVSSRFINGIIIPVIALTAQSMQSEEDREIYKNIPEYEKEDHVVFVVDGTKMEFPIPQELAPFVAPWRQLVEKAADANRHAWGELIMNDILATSAIDLSGVMDLDANMLYGDASLADRLSREAQVLTAQLAPTVVKTAYMAMTGIDPYTGNAIDTSSIYIDEDGNPEIIDSKSSTFTSWLSSALKGVGINLSGSSAHALIQSLLGNGGIEVLDMIGDLFSGHPESLLTTPGESIVSPFTPNSSNDSAQYAWNEAVKQLKQEKDAILNSKEYQTIAEGLANLDPSKADYKNKRNNLLRQYNQLVGDYQQKVYTAVKNLQSKYGADYDRKKFAATIGLMTFKKNFGTALSQVEKDATKTLSFEARSRALLTMAEYGFDSPSDLSIFGYMATDEYGNAEMKMYSPVAIMNIQSEVWGQTDIDIANIEAILDEYNIKRSDMFGDDYNKAKAAGKAALKKYKSDWNAKVIKAIAPYIEEHNMQKVINNSRTSEMLQRYIFVNNPYTAKEYLIKIFGGE